MDKAAIIKEVVRAARRERGIEQRERERVYRVENILREHRERAESVESIERREKEIEGIRRIPSRTELGSRLRGCDKFERQGHESSAQNTTI